MPEYKCPNCKKVFGKKNHLDNHLKRKKPCEKVDNTVLNKYELLIKKIEELQEDNKKLREEISEIKTIAKKSTKTVVSGNGKLIEGDDKSKNLIVININKFGEENQKMFTPAITKKILDRGYMSIPEFVKTLHYDKNVPENHNIYIPNWRDKNNALAYDGETWNLKDKNDILDDLKDKGITFIQKKYNDLDKNNKKDAIIIAKIDRFMSSFNDGEKDKMDELDKDIMLVLYNNRKITEKTKKQVKKATK